MESRINKYANLLIHKGINIQPGQTLVLSTSVSDLPFARLCVSAAYESGAKEVIVNWNDDYISKEKYLHGDDSLFDSVHNWEADMMNSLALDGAAFLSVASRDPFGMTGVDPLRIQRSRRASAKATSIRRELQNANKLQWCVAALPHPVWAKKIFPDMDEDNAMEELWNTILSSVRINDNTDPETEWDNHTNELVNKISILDKYEFKYLHYENSLGTDLIIELPENHFWDGAREITEKGVQFIPNMPTEEIFTAPERNGVNGIAYASKPLVVQGSLVDEFYVEFENGRIVNFHANFGQELLKSVIETDEGSHYLGEAALVPYNSPISQSGILFYNTLFDENAACHLALGSSYPNVKGASNMSNDERMACGLNSSMIHCDFMIGTPDMSITGFTKNGIEVPVFKNGDFAL